MIRKIIFIDRDKCTGCGLCAKACHEGAIAMKDGKAFLIRDDYCDGLGDCLPHCPAEAISFVMREAIPYDEKAVNENKAALQKGLTPDPPRKSASALRQWPTQIKLMPIKAEYFNNASILIAADCTAFAYADIHRDFMEGKVVMNGCPKLDNQDYSEKISLILSQNNIKDITVLRMEVPCCGGLTLAVKRAIEKCGKSIPLNTVTVTTDGNIL